MFMPLVTGFIHPRWCCISSINMIGFSRQETLPEPAQCKALGDICKQVQSNTCYFPLLEFGATPAVFGVQSSAILFEHWSGLRCVSCLSSLPWSLWEKSHYFLFMGRRGSKVCAPCRSMDAQRFFRSIERQITWPEIVEHFAQFDMFSPSMLSLLVGTLLLWQTPTALLATLRSWNIIRASMLYQPLHHEVVSAYTDIAVSVTPWAHSCMPWFSRNGGGWPCQIVECSSPWHAFDATWHNNLQTWTVTLFHSICHPENEIYYIYMILYNYIYIRIYLNMHYRLLLKGTRWNIVARTYIQISLPHGSVMVTAGWPGAAGIAAAAAPASFNKMGRSHPLSENIVKLLNAHIFQGYRSLLSVYLFQFNFKLSKCL